MDGRGSEKREVSGQQLPAIRYLLFRSELMRKGILLFLLLVFALAAAGQERYVKPVDDAAKDASFLAFRTKLIAAAERKDLKYVMSVMDPKIELSFGGHQGVKDFRELWKDEAAFWKEFLAVIKNGGTFAPPTEASGRMFVAPYTFSTWPDALDAFEHHVIFGNNVNMRDTPKMDGRVTDKLSYNIVKITGAEPEATEQQPDKEPEWYRIETLGGKKGWVKSEFVRSPISYRAGFEKRKGIWKMTYFIAGD